MAPHVTAFLLRRRERARLHFGVHTLLVFAATVVLGVPFALLVVLVHERHDWLQTLDQRVADNLHDFGRHHPAFVTTMRVASDVGAPGMWWIPVVAAALLLWRRGAKRPAAFAIVALGGSWLLNRLVKGAVDRTRPHLTDPFGHPGGASFPSGHAQAVTVACGVLLILAWPYLRRRGRWIAACVAGLAVVAVSFSRVALGVHYLSDVVAAAVLGLAWLLLMTAAFTAWQHEATGVNPDET